MSFEERKAAAREEALRDVDVDARVHAILIRDLQVAQEQRNSLTESELERRLQETREQFQRDVEAADRDITELTEAVNHLQAQEAGNEPG